MPQDSTDHGLRALLSFIDYCAPNQVSRCKYRSRWGNEPAHGTGVQDIHEQKEGDIAQIEMNLLAEYRTTVRVKRSVCLVG